ncbi:hypothetical protein BS78_K076900 [Paspalum vaginatum]|uniref:Uncharacterized protein n=1 Tax=Paspalum vaginatum TaxID=158149 RepID=A0A9W7XC17_9POAL|nr:hypothetical protein BS78_K076900 [Paspalum vaginatum]
MPFIFITDASCFLGPATLRMLYFGLCFKG